MLLELWIAILIVFCYVIGLSDGLLVWYLFCWMCVDLVIVYFAYW